ncbi:MFS monocarboxylate transporter [Colletotrichum scovillei]|uniref:Major facilitator superfamily transporter n=1 Tax=Colletotrichum scovillei TaxID=1209932 RepID=A0A9P7RDC1_9PEZI|nr:MFS monocarboxylate transporter [Colletotrichum scovillei]KAF4785391.1 MFS monocarboxylate transporter [Colletotrichum scovillei]KAG7055236.1 hypothetical protein JMJ77_0007701 [Colletotrichum scovillei]KAG7074681.1 hypothetical protein JMJ76_0011155 [Colletotrichum scovillei]KAG7081867.1 hypothetical protein JMJ78_0003979 [Colletotrichum scovillei]
MGERESLGPTLAIAPIPINPETDTSDFSNVNNDAASEETEFLRWSCVGAAGLFLMCSYGFSQSIGTVQSFLQLNQLSDSSAQDIGWITGLDTALSLLCGFQVGPLMDRYGPRLLAPVAVGLTVAKFFLLSECQNYWQIFLCLGVLGGIASAVASTVAISAVGKLFIRRRGLAMGAAMAGASLGGISFPLVLRRAFPALGWSWSNRVMGFVVLGLMTVGMVLLLPFPKLILPSAVSSKKKSAALNFDAFRSGPFVFITLGFFLYEFSITGVGVLLPTFAVKAGFPSAMGYTLVSILNGCSCLGRLLPGLAGDYVGHFDVILFMTCLSLIFTGALFVPFGGQSAGILYAFAGLWGFCTGSFLSILPVCLGKTCDPKDYGRYYGTMTFFVSFSALTAIPAGGSLLEKVGSVGASGLYLSTVALGGLSFYTARSLLIGKFLVFRSNI